MKQERQNILLLGSEVKVINLPIKEISLLSKGCLPVRIHAGWRIEREREVDRIRKENKLRAVW
jgi:hypothetical protein